MNEMPKPKPNQPFYLIHLAVKVKTNKTIFLNKNIFKLTLNNKKIEISSEG